MCVCVRTHLEEVSKVLRLRLVLWHHHSRAQYLTSPRPIEQHYTHSEHCEAWTDSSEPHNAT
eukprot:812030-Rhodomonas_salina.1